MPLGQFADPSQWTQNPLANGIANPARTGAFNQAGQISPPGMGGGGATPEIDYETLVKSLIGTIQAPSMGGSGIGAMGMNPITKSFISMMQQANQANAARGQSILKLLDGQGKAQMQTNQKNFDQQTADIDESMISKGLSGTTVGTNLKQGAANELARNNEQVTENSALNTANMANSFTQQGPSMELLARLMESGGGGVGGGGFGTAFRQAPPSGMEAYGYNGPGSQYLM